jgi:hypothetical protein
VIVHRTVNKLTQLSNSETEKRKEEIAKEIAQINNSLTNSSIRSAGGCGFTQKEIDEKKAKLISLQKEYRSLPNKIITLEPIAVNKVITYENSRYKLKFSHVSKQFEFYDGNEYLSSDVSFPDENTVKIVCQKQSSDYHGQVVDYVYTLKVYTAKDPDPRTQKVIKHSIIFPKGYITPTEPEQPKQPISQAVDKKTGISKAAKFLHRRQ